MSLTGRQPYQKATAEQRKRDKEFREWLKTLPCVIGAGCSGDGVAAHVRLGGNGGTGYKPLFSAVPMCWLHHGEQHQHGHTHFGDDDWWLRQADRYYRRWLQLVR